MVIGRWFLPLPLPLRSPQPAPEPHTSSCWTSTCMPKRPPKLACQKLNPSTLLSNHPSSGMSGKLAVCPLEMRKAAGNRGTDISVKKQGFNFSNNKKSRVHSWFCSSVTSGPASQRFLWSSLCSYLMDAMWLLQVQMSHLLSRQAEGRREETMLALSISLDQESKPSPLHSSESVGWPEALCGPAGARGCFWEEWLPAWGTRKVVTSARLELCSRFLPLAAATRPASQLS